MTSRAAFGAGCAAYAVTLVVVAIRLPDRVPTHFGASGAADTYSSRTGAVLAFAVAGAAVAVVLGGTAMLTPRLPVSAINLPDKAWWTATPDRERVMRAMLRADLLALGAATMLLLAVVVVLVAHASTQARPRLGVPAWAALAGWLLVVLGWTVHCVRTRYRAPGGPHPA